jgi:hypothetical protein
MLYESVPKDMATLKQYLGKELFELCFKLAQEVESTTGDQKASLGYL